MKQPKNDRSEPVLGMGENGDVYKAYVEFFKDEDDDFSGYYGTLIKVDVEKVEDGYTITHEYYEYMEDRLLVQCSRRSEKNFKKAIEIMNANVPVWTKKLDEEIKNGAVDEDKKTLNELLRKIIDESSDKEIKKVNNKEVNKEMENKVEKKGLTFDDVVGMHDVKEQLNDVIDQFNNRAKYDRFGIKPIRGLLLYGLPGTGKSYISNAFANEIDAEFIKIDLGTIGSKYQNVTSNNIKKIFNDARKKDGNVVLFLDECESIASKRGTDENSKEKNITLNQLLQEMSSRENDNIFIICATNFYELLDDAFTRSGRIDVKIEIPLPDYETRKGILELNCKNKPLADNVDLDKIAKNTSGMNCADVDVIVNEGARLAIKRNKDVIEQIDLEDSFEQMICGKASKTRKLDDKTKRIVALHESAHCLVNELLNVNKTKKISILPRGNTLGYLLHTNEDNEDVFLRTENDIRNTCKVALAGRAIEEIVFGEPTTGASNDLVKSTQLVEQMICNFGYSKEFGLVVVDRNDILLKEKVKNVAKEILDELYNETKNLLMENQESLFELANELVDKEELNGEEVEEILNKYRVINN